MIMPHLFSSLSIFHPSRNDKYVQRGMSLMEVMVTLLVLGAGVLGIMALQTTTLKNVDSSAWSSQATVQVYAMFDLLRSRRDAIGTVDSRLLTPSNNDGWAQSQITPQQRNHNELGSLEDWLAGLKETVGADAWGKVHCVSRERQTPRPVGVPLKIINQCTVGIRWDDSHADGKSTRRTVEMTLPL